MAHLLLLEVPGGNDFALLEDAVAAGHDVTFVTADLAHYRSQGEATLAALAQAREVIEVAPFTYPQLEQAALALHARRAVDAILCLIDIRLVEASLLAEKLDLRFLNPATTRLMRDKVSVRQTLARKGIRQPKFALAESADQVHAAVLQIGFPVLVKPADGYGSQNVNVVESKEELERLLELLDGLTAHPIDYGLGVQANNRYSVEQYIRGSMIGCDVFSNTQERVLLGINDKLMFPPPSFAIRGSCFPSARYDTTAIKDYAFQILDAVNFDFGAAHIEMIVADDGPYLVEVNPRLVSAQIPYQMGYALQRSINLDLIDLHLGASLAELRDIQPRAFSAIRWMTAARAGTLSSIDLPQRTGDEICRVVLFKKPGDLVKPPLSNGDRIGYVIATGATQLLAEQAADRYVHDTDVAIL